MVAVTEFMDFVWSNITDCLQNAKFLTIFEDFVVRRWTRTRTRTCELVLEDPRGQGLSLRTTTLAYRAFYTFLDTLKLLFTFTSLPQWHDVTSITITVSTGKVLTRIESSFLLLECSIEFVWCGGVVVMASNLQPRGRRFESRLLCFTYNPGQVVHTRVPLFSGTGASWELNRHSTRHTSPVSVELQLRLWCLAEGRNRDQSCPKGSCGSGLRNLTAVSEFWQEVHK